ncbi:MAG TPA: cytochrome C [Nitrospirota bacterium]|nr:cytochrome C [Nitrospirota bacterium]
MKSIPSKLLTLGILMAALAATLFAACVQTASIAKKHPVEVEAMPICADCHTDWRAAMNHTPDFITRHKFYADQQRQACDICHAEAFCADCHANNEEVKPSDKYKDSPDRALPHRGDYLTQHQIDGRINPASCFPCHGRQNNERCKECHK